MPNPHCDVLYCTAEMLSRVWMALSWMAATLLLCMPRKIARNLIKCVVKIPLLAEMIVAIDGEDEAEAVIGTETMTEEEGEITTVAVGMGMRREVVEVDAVAVVIEDTAVVVTETETETAAVLIPETETETEAETTGSTTLTLGSTPDRQPPSSGSARLNATAPAARTALSASLFTSPDVA